MHWGYGIAWAGAYALAAGSFTRPRAVWGLPFGAAVWLAAYTLLPLSGLYRPISEYEPTALGQDLLGYLAYGGTMGLAFRLLAPGGKAS